MKQETHIIRELRAAVRGGGVKLTAYDVDRVACSFKKLRKLERYWIRAERAKCVERTVKSAAGGRHAKTA